LGYIPVADSLGISSTTFTKYRRHIADNFNHLSRVHERYRRQTDGRAIAYSEREREFTFAKNRQNDRLYAYPSTKKKDVVTKRLRTHINVQSVMASVGESHVVDITPV